MAVVTDPEFVAETLAWCNEIRAEKNLEPLDVLPKGKRYDGNSCQCGKATGLHVETGLAYPQVENWQDHPARELPAPVICFVDAFDLGDLPQYDEAHDAKAAA